jgi:Protein UNC80
VILLVFLVSDLAFHTLWEGIIEDASLFLRHILEKVSNKDKQNFILRKLRRLMGHMPSLPHQAAATLFNHLVCNEGHVSWMELSNNLEIVFSCFIDGLLHVLCPLT